MENKVTINGKDYALKTVDFNGLCLLEETYGVSIPTIKSSTFTALRGILAYLMGKDVEVAGKEIESHIASGGKLADLTPLLTVVTESDFFRNLSK